MNFRLKPQHILAPVGILVIIGTCFLKEKTSTQAATEKEAQVYQDSMKNPAFAAREKDRIAVEEADAIRKQAAEDSLYKVVAAAKHKARYGWHYSATEDPMTSDSVYAADITSLQQLAPPPVWEPGKTTSGAKSTTTYKKRLFSNKRYPVTQTTTTTSTGPDRKVTHYADVFLEIRKNASGTTDVMLHATSGGFAGLYDGVRIRFDKNKAERYKTLGPADGGNLTLFLQPAGAIVKKLRKCKRLLIEASVEGNGTQLFEFETENLQWKH